MIKRRRVISIFIASLFISTFALAQEENLLKLPSAFSFKPLHFSPPEPARHELKNGMVVYLLEDHEIPVVHITALIRTGSIYETDKKAGLAELTGVVMRTGGTKSMSGNAIDEELEFMACSINVGISSQSGSASLTVLKKDLDKGLRIYTDILRHPVFAQEKVDLAKKQKEEELRRENDEPQAIAFREFKKVLYRNNPRGIFPTISSIQKIKREDIIQFHQKYFYPERIILGVSGDFYSEEMLDKLEKLFGDWEKAREALPQVSVPTPQQESVNLISKDAPQSVIILGHLAVPKNNPDFYPFTLLNYILGGGGFNSRLTADIRSNRGLAYSVGSFYRGDIDYGAFGAYCFTKSSTTREVIDLMLKNIQDIRDKGITEQELQWAKDSIINSFIFSFTSSHQIVVETMDIEYNHLPQDYLKMYQEKISKLTREDIERVAKTYLHPENPIFLVVGNDKDFEKPLTDLGKVNRIELAK